MKILFLSPWFPTPPVNGSKIRIYHLIKALSGQHAVSLLSFVRPGEVVDIQAAESLCQEVKTVPFREFQPQGWQARLGYFSRKPRSVVDTYSSQMAHMVSNLIGEADCVIASEMVTVPYVQNHRVVPYLWDDVELAAGRDALQNSTGLTKFRRWLTWQKTCRYVPRILSRLKAVTVVSDIEKNILNQIASKYSCVRVLPNGVDTEYNHPGLADPQPGRLVYPGSLTYSANYDAVKFFLDVIFPLIRQGHPNAHLQITGSTQGVDLSGLPLNSAVGLTGYLGDIRPVVASAWVCVVSLRQGSGTRLKILEAMALGTPVVSTSKGAEGLAVTHEQDILIADDPADFARQVGRLLEDAELRGRLAVNGRKLVEQLYDWAQIGKDFCALVEEAAK